MTTTKTNEIKVGDYVVLNNGTTNLRCFVSLRAEHVCRVETVTAFSSWAHVATLTPAHVDPTPLFYKMELAKAREHFAKGTIAEVTLRRAAQNYIDAIKAYGRQEKKRVPVPTIAKLLR